MATTPTSGRFQPYILEPGSPSAFSCFGTWENSRTCLPIAEVDDALDGCSQSAECRRYTLEQNPPTTRFRVKPRRDGRFELQQFRDFIREQSGYHMDITEGLITITYPGKRAVPKSKRFFLHVKHLEEANLDVDGEFELIMSLEKMVLRQATALSATSGARRTRPVDDDPEARRRRIAEKLRKKASEDARSKDDVDDELDIDIDIDEDDLDIDLDDDDDDDDDDVEEEEADDADDDAESSDDEEVVAVDDEDELDVTAAPGEDDDEDDDDDGDDDEEIVSE